MTSILISPDSLENWSNARTTTIGSIARESQAKTFRPLSNLLVATPEYPNNNSDQNPPTKNENRLLILKIMTHTYS